eukprot:TRINITY_DN838_c2_g1_i2.p1 TRINITY_DN838_c2_g1~~TRINITY_DN838_c2_g1_i2.p1  ORF type:complete len:571 (+),score=150.41 TRINITY_DN838_c2_g1_i2:32-1714(+)
MSTSNRDEFNKAKAFLLKAGEGGYSVYDHIVNMVQSAVEKNPGGVGRNINRFPAFSEGIKKQRFDPMKSDCGIKYSKPDVDERDIKRAKEEQALFTLPEPEVVTEVHQPTPFTTVTTTTVKPLVVPPCRPLSEDVKYHKMAGIGLPRKEYLMIQQALTKLTMDFNVDDVTFWGKIFGTEKNYIIACSKRYLSEGEEMWEEKYAMARPPRKGVEVPIQTEPPGVGLNRVTYWVCEYAGATWKPLPDVTPQQVTTAKQIKKYFTGDLTRSVHSYPPFPGTEANYLRAQLARITAATHIMPEGEVELYEDEGDDEEEEEDDENKPKTRPLKYKPLTTQPKPITLDDGIASLASREKWVHTDMYIYKTGRGTMLPPKPEVEGEEEEAAEEDEAEEEKEQEEKKELLQAVVGDLKYATIKIPQEPKEDEDGEGEGEEKEEEEDKEDEEEEDNPGKLTIPAWKAEVTNNLYHKHGVVVVKSLRWPGACSWASSGNTSGRVYFGDGLKSTDPAFAPRLPPPVLQETDDLQEVADPASMFEKLILRGEEPKEGDSEDEKEEEEEETAE